MFTAIVGGCAVLVAAVWGGYVLARRRVKTRLQKNAEGIAGRARPVNPISETGKVQVMMDDPDGQFLTLVQERGELQRELRTLSALAHRWTLVLVALLLLTLLVACAEFVAHVIP